MGYHTILSGQRFTFDSVKEVMAKAGCKLSNNLQ